MSGRQMPLAKTGLVAGRVSQSVQQGHSSIQERDPWCGVEICDMASAAKESLRKGRGVHAVGHTWYWYRYRAGEDGLAAYDAREDGSPRTLGSALDAAQSLVQAVQTRGKRMARGRNYMYKYNGMASKWAPEASTGEAPFRVTADMTAVADWLCWWQVGGGATTLGRRRDWQQG
ncbi:Nn.00g106390.m01.CDS01 [Neocucurbitaria sp. VM-36]